MTDEAVDEKREHTLLIDGDSIAFRAAAACQRTEEDSFGFVHPFANVREGMATVDNMLLGLMDRLGGTHMKIVLSDPESNWRHGVLPSYKSNRAPKLHSRPLLLGRLKEYLRVKYGASHWASLEADDVLGILMTEPQQYPGMRTLVGFDKDFKQIAGRYHRMGDYGTDGKPVVNVRTKLEADQFHMQQTLSGDDIDGYFGVPGLGPVRAERLVFAPVVLRPERGVITRGKNKGNDTVKWMSEPTSDLWQCIVSHFEKEGLTEADALRNARVARILRHGDYDRENERIILWEPSRLKR